MPGSGTGCCIHGKYKLIDEPGTMGKDKLEMNASPCVRSALSVGVGTGFRWHLDSWEDASVSFNACMDKESMTPQPCIFEIDDGMRQMLPVDSANVGFVLTENCNLRVENLELSSGPTADRLLRYVSVGRSHTRVEVKYE